LSVAGSPLPQALILLRTAPESVPANSVSRLGDFFVVPNNDRDTIYLSFAARFKRTFLNQAKICASSQ
jgi:hypothetical protein